jgi:transposase
MKLMKLMKLNYGFRLYPSGVQISRLQETLEACRGVYNTALTQRRLEWRQGRDCPNRDFPTGRPETPAETRPLIPYPPWWVSAG